MFKAKVRTERVRQILFRRGITQNYLAHRLKISSGYCSQLLSGVRHPSPSLRVRLMRELKEDFDTLFEQITPPHSSPPHPNRGGGEPQRAGGVLTAGGVLPQEATHA